MFHLGQMLTYRPAHPAGYVLIESAHDIAPAEVAALLAELVEDPDVQPDARVLIDVRDAASAWTTSQVNLIVPAFRALARRGVAAIAIVADVDVAYGMSRMLSTRLDGLGLAAAVFRSSPEAEDWLDRRTS
jgi:hypothetical protein